MTKNDVKLQLFLSLARLQATITRRLDAGLNGLAFSEFIILWHLSQAENETLRRVDLADRLGLTASGITRLLAPMEKVGLVKHSDYPHDARVSLIALASGGRRKLAEAAQDAELLLEDFTAGLDHAQLQALNDAAVQINSNIKLR